ncbi:synaptotagmin-2-like protein [Sarcoptes scabiei]|uniref:Synaptotagmin-2-like protein n=1 Tax=Sarcoptes scabiei TaxID=52283 RepID=A0A132ABN9_SARSC|nr:synaptotagmin-2-like protein [Sarcoptes scabiei]
MIAMMMINLIAKFSAAIPSTVASFQSPSTSPAPKTIMSSLLSENDKLVIIAIAASLILFTLLFTVCFVSPWCLLHRLLSRWKHSNRFDLNDSFETKSTKHSSKSQSSYPSIEPKIESESKHFYLSIVPVYGGKNEKSASISHPYGSMNQFEHLTSLAESTRIRYSLCQNQFKSNESNRAIPLKIPKLEAKIVWRSLNETTIQLIIKVHRIFDLSFRESQTEPSPYLIVILSGYRLHRKSFILKGSKNELFRTKTIKKTTDALFNTQPEFVSEELPKVLLKEATLKFRLMDEERYANDVCLAELSIPMKKIKQLDELLNENKKKKRKIKSNESIRIGNDFDQNQNEIKRTDSMVDDVDGDGGGDSSIDAIETDADDAEQFDCFTMFPINEIKGELLVGFCYLPTSKRINITVVKGTIKSGFFKTYTQAINNNLKYTQIDSNLSHQAFFIKVLMFHNGKLIKKKKSSLSIRLIWGANETISIDLPEDSMENVRLMLILAYKLQNVNSPQSPESPENTAPPPPSSFPPSTNEIVEKDSTKQNIENDAMPKQFVSKANDSYCNSNGTNSNNLHQQQRRDSSSGIDANKVGRQTNSDSKNSFKHYCIGHFVLDGRTWIEEIIGKPRRQLLKWYKLC